MRARAIVAGAILMCGLGWPAGAAAEPASASSHCGRIVFEPQTDNAAVNIHARGTSCRRARRIVRAVYRSVPPFGYRCRSRAHDDGGLFHRHWTCVKNEARVTWAKF